MRFKGVAFLAAMHKRFPQKAVQVFHFVENPALAVLWGTFGGKTEFIRSYLIQAKEGPHLLEIYLMNGVCQRKKNCQKGELCRRCSVTDWNEGLKLGTASLIRKIEKRITKITKFIEEVKNSNTTPILTLALEDNFDTVAAKRLAEIVGNIWPHKLCRNPVGNNASKVPARTHCLELHGVSPSFPSKVKNQLISLDGVDIDWSHRKVNFAQKISETQAQNWFKANAKTKAVTYLWSALHQGLTGDSAGSPPPRERKPKVPNGDIQKLNLWLRNA